MRPFANSAARSWKLRTARDSESLKRSKRANGDDGATGCGTGTGTGAGTGAGAGGTIAAAGGGAARDEPAGRRDAGGGGGDPLRVGTLDTRCLPPSSHPGKRVGLRVARDQ